MSRKHLQDIINNLQEFYKCPSCDTSYHLDDIHYLGELNSFCFVQLNCHECSLPVLATVPLGGKMPKRSKTDLRQAEEAKFASMGNISADEIADFHRYISRRKGGFQPQALVSAKGQYLQKWLQNGIIVRVGELI